MRYTLALVASLTLCGGCFLFRGDLPSDSCENNAHCFVAQGERCNLDTRRCETVPDAGTAALVGDPVFAPEAPALDAPALDAPASDAPALEAQEADARDMPDQLGGER